MSNTVSNSCTNQDKIFYRISEPKLKYLNALHYKLIEQALDKGRIQGFIIGIGFTLLGVAMYSI